MFSLRTCILLSSSKFSTINLLKTRFTKQYFINTHDGRTFGERLPVKIINDQGHKTKDVFINGINRKNTVTSGIHENFI